VSIVTGAGRGLGHGIARALAGAGSDLMIASRSIDELERVAQELLSPSPKLLSRK